MGFKLVPTDDKFFALFSQSAGMAHECAGLLRDLVTDFTDVPRKFEQIVALERSADEVTQGILKRLDTSFVTPFDREDIHRLAEELDDVVDDIVAVCDLLQLLPIEEILPEMAELSRILCDTTEQSVGLFSRFESMKGIQPYLDRIDQLETEADSVYRRTIARLFQEGDPMRVLMWKDIVQALEAAVNTVEDISNVVESIVLKHA